MATSAGSPATRERAMRVLAGILLLVGMASAGSVLLLQRDYRFDDAFISYRYAKNLAQGHGLRWNRGEAPVEGYTNFLLVVALAPVVRAGIDPLRVTQALSVLAAVGLCGMLARLARRQDGATRADALVVAAVFLSQGAVGFLCVLGLETVIYASALFAAFVGLATFLQTPSGPALAFACLWLLVAFLLRPEALLLVVAALPAFVSQAWPDHRRFLRARYGWIVSGALIMPILVYAGWKLAHFGDLLPAPFYIKASGARLVSALGVDSVLGYYTQVKGVVVLALLATIVPKASAVSRQVAFAFAVLYTLFYLRVDTLMDVGHRFLYPVTPFLVALAIPAVVALGRALRGVGGIAGWSRVVAVAAAAILLLYAEPAGIARTVAQAMRGRSAHAETPQAEYVLAQRLNQYEAARDLTIALGDAGLVPYYTDAIVIDAVGLNDRVISRGGDVQELVAYVFSRQPTLILYPTNADFSLIRHGHGPLGDLTRWAQHSGWRDYTYAGTFKHAGYYPIHLFVRRGDSRLDRLTEFLRTRVADVILDPLPFRLGPRPDGR